MFLRYKLNYKYTIVHTGSFEKLPVLKRDGEIISVRFLGFIEREEAKLSKNATPCKIRSIVAYSKLNFNYTDLPKNSLIQGCILNGGLYCIIEQDKPRIIALGT